jgi:glycosyltransferase involved in cell wall biosynthesis
VVRKVAWGSDLVSRLAEAFNELAAAPQERARLGDAALRYVGERHSWSRSAELYVEAIEAACHRLQSRRPAARESGSAAGAEKAA